MDLQVNVAQLLKERVGSTRDVDLHGPVLEVEDSTPADVHGKLKLTRTDQGVWALGTVDISVDTACSRCLALFTMWVRVNVDEVYLPTIEINTGAKVRYDSLEDADAMKIDEHHVIDFTEAFRQYRLAAAPMAPVCREGCRGICPQCGTDLNVTVCTCEPEMDPRWAKLRELLN